MLEIKLAYKEVAYNDSKPNKGEMFCIFGQQKLIIFIHKFLSAK
jgi:hypothetical protein